MKITRLFAVVMLFFGLSALPASAQVNEECASNSSISHEAVKAGNFKAAYAPWKEVLKDCPLLRYYTFTDGFEILTSFLGEAERGSEDYNKYFDELMLLHDTRMKFIPDFVEKGLGGIPSNAEAIGLKLVDYLQYSTNPDIDQAYAWAKESVEKERENSQPIVLFHFISLSQAKIQMSESHKEQFITDYLLAVQSAQGAIDSMTDETYKNVYAEVKTNLTAMFINSGAADCEFIQSTYGPIVEENKDNLDRLQEIAALMKSLGCRDQDAYAQANYYAYQIEPTPEAALGCGVRAYKKGDINEAIKFIDEAIELETDVMKKAENAYASATILFSVKRYSQSRNYALKALSYNPNYGSAYILIAKLYGSSPNWSDDPIMNRCTYFLVLDKLYRAKSVDSSVAQEANELINLYSQHTPSTQDLFMMGYKKGDSVKIGGWIGESTTIK